MPETFCNGIFQKNKKALHIFSVEGINLIRKLIDDIQNSYSHEEQVSQSSNWPWLVENLQPAGHHGNQEKLNAEGKLGVEVESWILNKDTEPVDKTYQGYATPTQEIQLSLPRPVFKRFIGVVSDHPYPERN